MSDTQVVCNRRKTGMKVGKNLSRVFMLNAHMVTVIGVVDFRTAPPNCIPR